MIAVSTTLSPTAGTFAAPPDAPVYAVVGFDGSHSSLRAVDAAARLLHDRPGGIEIVYVAHLPVIAGMDLHGQAVAEMRQNLDDAARELSLQVRDHLQSSRLGDAAQHWHFQRRDGAVADQLIAAADELRLQRGPDATVVLVVGRSEHGYHHILGSVPQALERHDHYPVIVIP
jgi:nucleotide-binding universal stress UspA family protein